MKKSKKCEKLFCTAVYVVFAVFYLWLAAQIPYTCDDWDWGLDIGIEQWLTASVNSRYVGNFFEIIATRSEIAKMLIMGCGFFLLPFLGAHIAFGGTDGHHGTKQVIGFLLGNVLLLSMPRYIWQQTYGWVAGYVNFGLSAIFLFMVLKQLLSVFDNTAPESNRFRPRTVVLFLITLAGQLFIENLAIYVFLASLVVNLIYWFKSKRVSWDYLSIFLAALIGLCIMFSSSIYGTLWTTGEAIDGYRELIFHSGSDITASITQIIQYLLRIPGSIYSYNTSICAAITVLRTVLMLKKKFRYIGLKIICCALNGLFVFALLFIPNATKVSIAFFLIVLIDLFLLFKKEKPLLLKLLCIWFSPIVIILPLAFTGEIGSRLFFSTNAVLILFAVILLRCALTSTGKSIFFCVITCALASALMLQYGLVYYAIGQCQRQMENAIEIAIETGADTICLPRYPYQEYLWNAYPKGSAREGYFKRFYNIPLDTTVIFES